MEDVKVADSSCTVRILIGLLHIASTAVALGTRQAQICPQLLPHVCVRCKGCVNFVSMFSLTKTYNLEATCYIADTRSDVLCWNVVFSRNVDLVLRLPSCCSHV